MPKSNFYSVWGFSVRSAGSKVKLIKSNEMAQGRPNTSQQLNCLLCAVLDLILTPTCITKMEIIFPVMRAWGEKLK